ncbi:unnamed protein product, partial [Heterosigma akashiwo]
MAWTPAGGDLLFVECSRMPGKGHLVTTGQLGEVMKESAAIAMAWIRANGPGIAALVGCPPRQLRVDAHATDFHVHVPAGATPKDGPSAGVAIAAALLSLLTGRAVPAATAVTGEVTLSGLVLPVGGVKEKVLAAAAGGATRVLLPADNRADLDELPASVRAGGGPGGGGGLEFCLVGSLAEVLALLFQT